MTLPTRRIKKVEQEEIPSDKTLHMSPDEYNKDITFIRKLSWNEGLRKGIWLGFFITGVLLALIELVSIIVK